MPKIRGFALRMLRGVLWALLGWLVLTFGCVLALRWVDPIGSAFIARERFLAWWRDDPKFVYRHEWVDLDRISRPMQLAVIASEDQKFLSHRGFDFDSIENALQDRERGRRTRGASTISQQTAKNLFLWPGQSWVRKGIEAYLTALIELLWPKRRILEVYLNVAEFGPGVFGAEAAGQTFYRKSAVQLTTYDAALLAAVLPNPKRFKVALPSLYVRARQRWIMEQMRDLGGTGYVRNLDN